MARPSSTRSIRRTGLTRSAAALACAALSIAGLGSAPTADAAPTPAPTAPTTATASAVQAAKKTQEPGVTANLWEWNWPSIQSECPRLARYGYKGVQVAPPQNSVKRIALGNGSDTILHPWWEVYQPVSYNLSSRMGTEAQFKTMVTACRKAGVKVYVDAVINHMTGQGSTSYGGQNYTPYNYPAVPYTKANFHNGVTPKECPSSDGGIQDFNNVAQVFRCNLVGLEDLRTQTPYVRAQLAAYLNKLLGYGVSGFRVDAAKHIGQADLNAIYSKLRNTKDGVRPYWALEVFQGGPGILDPQAFTSSGDVLGLEGARQIQQVFKSYPDAHIGSLAALKVFGSGSGLTSSANTMSFVTNHDTDRNRGEYLGYKDGSTYLLANAWLLAEGYGSPQVYSSFTWSTGDDSPPASSNGVITNTVCGGSSPTWTCDHRSQIVVALVRWHNYAKNAKRANWWTDGGNVISFSKGSRTWAAFNNNTTAKTIRVQTGMRQGTYCDKVHDTAAAGCSAKVKVNSTGFASLTVPAKSAVAIRRIDRL